MDQCHDAGFTSIILNDGTMKTIFISVLLIAFISIAISTTSSGQNTITLDSCYILARNNYPLIKQFDLIERTRVYTIDNAWKGKLPQVSLSAQATYQSDVTNVPINIPDIQIPSPTRDQYNLHADISQSINDLYTIKDKVALAVANSATEIQKNEIELYRLKDRINQLYFGILLLDAQLSQMDLLKKSIQIGLDKTKVSIQNGTAIKSSAIMLEAELLKADQRKIELNATRKAYLDLLSTLIGKPLDQNTKLEKPSAAVDVPGIKRPELKLYELQRHAFDLQNKILVNDMRPRFSIFLQTGIGKPALNFLNPDFDFYYLAGLKMNWNLSARYTFRNQQQLLLLNQQSIDLQQEVFLFNTNLSLNHQRDELAKYQDLLNTDQELIAMRESVSKTTAIQLENGTATVNDYITNVNAEEQARQNMAIHEIQFQLAQYNYLNTSGYE